MRGQTDNWCYGEQAPSLVLWRIISFLPTIHKAQCNPWSSVYKCMSTHSTSLAWLLSWCAWTVERTFYFLLFKGKTLHRVKEKQDPFFKYTDILLQKSEPPYFLHRPSIVILYILSKQSASSDISLMLWCHGVSQYYLDQWWNKWIWSLSAKYLSHHT